MMDKESNLENLKMNYVEVQKKYNLPSFEELNADFNIEKISDIETDFLVREIRKFIADKFSNYLRFIETILHPTDVPMFVFSIIKSLGAEEKKKLVEIYKKLALSEIKLIELDLDFFEEKEADFVKDSYKLWQKLKKDLLEVMDGINQKWDTKFETNNKGYFG